MRKIKTSLGTFGVTHLQTNGSLPEYKTNLDDLTVTGVFLASGGTANNLPTNSSCIIENLAFSTWYLQRAYAITNDTDVYAVRGWIRRYSPLKEQWSAWYRLPLPTLDS